MPGADAVGELIRPTRRERAGGRDARTCQDRGGEQLVFGQRRRPGAIQHPRPDALVGRGQAQRQLGIGFEHVQVGVDFEAIEGYQLFLWKAHRDIDLLRLQELERLGENGIQAWRAAPLEQETHALHAATARAPRASSLLEKTGG